MDGATNLNKILVGDYVTAPLPPDKNVDNSGIKENITHTSEDVNPDAEMTKPSTENTEQDLHENEALPENSTKSTDNVKLDEQANRANESDVDDLGPLTFYQNDQKFGNTMEALKVQREEGKYCDTVLIAGSQQFKVHACVLAGNSTYFDVLLSATDEHAPDTKEYNLIFPTNNHKVAKLLLDYMYTGYLGVNMTTIGDMITTSRQLGMDDVIQCCNMHLLNNLSLGTWAQIYEIAKTNELSELRSDLHKYMAKNFANVCKTKGFLGIDYEDLKAIFTECSSIKTINIIQYQFCALLSWVAARYSERVDHYSPLANSMQLERLGTSFVTAALNSEQIFNTGLIDHFCSIEILEKLAMKESQSKKKSRKSTKPTKVVDETSPEQVSQGNSSVDLGGEDDIESDLEMSCDDVTVTDYATNGSDCIYDAGSYERMLAAQDADDDEYIPNQPLNRLKPQTLSTRQRGAVKRAHMTQGDTTPPTKRKRPEVIKVASLPREETPKKSTSSPGKRKSWSSKETMIQCEWPGCTHVYSSRRKMDLEDHMNMHNGIRPHECSVCGKAFSARKHRQRHEKIHLEVPPIPCTVEGCVFRTTRGDKLRDHMIRNHGFIPNK